MNISFFNGSFLAHGDICISPDDRGFLFAEGVYEVARWYGAQFLDIESHTARLKRSLKEMKIVWPEADNYPAIARELIIRNNLTGKQALVYLQVTRGAAKRTHAYPSPPVSPTVYAFAVEKQATPRDPGTGIGIMLTEDIRWGRCDIKSISLLANTMGYQEALGKNMQECLFVRDGVMTECSHSNIFFVKGNIIYTHPESNYILAGVTRKIILRLARELGIGVVEEPVRTDDLSGFGEIFIGSTSFEITPVTNIDGMKVGSGKPGSVTRLITDSFEAGLISLKG